MFKKQQDGQLPKQASKGSHLTHHLRWVLCVPMVASLAIGCGKDKPQRSTGTGGAAGSDTGGASSSGGATATGGNSGTGGAVMTGGLTRDDVEELSYGSFFGNPMCLVDENDTVQCWPKIDRVSAEMDGLQNISQVGIGANSGCALSKDGELSCFGGEDDGIVSGAHGTTGVRSISMSKTPGRGAMDSSVLCAVTEADELKCWGSNYFGVVSRGNTVTDVSAVDVSNSFVCVRHLDDSPECWGWDSWGVEEVPDITDVVSIAAGQVHACALRENSEIVCWGNPPSVPNPNTGYVQMVSDSSHVCGLRTDGTVSCSGLEGTPDLANVVGISTAPSSACARKDDGSVVCWGPSHTHLSSPPTGLSSVQKVQTTLGQTEYTCAIKANGELECWGIIDDELAVAIAAFKDVTQVAISSESICTLDTSGTIHCDSGSADGTENIAQIEAGDRNLCALGTDASVQCWGNDDSRLVSDAYEGTDAEQIEVGTNFACVRKTDNSLACWGSDEYGKLTDMPTDTDIVDVALGTGHACALHSDDRITCWGAHSSEPERVTPPEGLSDVSSLVLGAYNSCALLDDGTARCWGLDRLGSITGAQAAAGLIDLTASWSHICGVKSDNTVKCWGTGEPDWPCTPNWCGDWN